MEREAITLAQNALPSHPQFTLDDARALARTAHAGQVDKLGVDYLDHVEAVAAGLVDFDLDVQIAGMLHDVVEDSDLTLDALRVRGVSERSLAAIELVSRNLHPELTYQEAIARICASRDATLVKISDNAHNSRPDRVRELADLLGVPPNPRYAEARSLLYAAVPLGDVEMVLRRTTPSLREEMVLRSLDELLAYAELGGRDELAEWVDMNMDVDAQLVEDDEGLTLWIGHFGFGLDFPMTVGDFWEQVQWSEESAIAEIEASEP